MGGWNRSRYVRGHRDRRPSRPPLPPPDYGHKDCSVPLWEREFCCYVGDISWQRFCENKRYVGPYNNLEHWDDSGAFENFQNAKARFCANYHGQPSDIPLPDPDLYIDKVDHRCKVDPELVADLDQVRLPFDSDINAAAATEAGKKSSHNQSGNWDIFIEKPAETNNWESELTSRPLVTWGVKPEPLESWGRSNSGWESELASRPLATWGVKPEPFDNWGNSNSGWGDALANPSWHASSNNHESLNYRNDSYAGSNNRHQDRSNMSGRKRSSGGHFQHRNSRQRNQAEGYQRSGWQGGP